MVLVMEEHDIRLQEGFIDQRWYTRQIGGQRRESVGHDVLITRIGAVGNSIFQLVTSRFALYRKIVRVLGHGVTRFANMW